MRTLGYYTRMYCPFTYLGYYMQSNFSCLFHHIRTPRLLHAMHFLLCTPPDAHTTVKTWNDLSPLHSTTSTYFGYYKQCVFPSLPHEIHTLGYEVLCMCFYLLYQLYTLGYDMEYTGVIHQIHTLSYYT